MTNEQIIIDVQFNVGETEQKLGAVSKQIEELKNRNKELKNELKSGNGDWASLTAQIKSNEQEIKSLTVAEKELSGMISVADQQRRKYSDSFKGQSALLADLKNQYSSLSKSERESAGGQEMLKHLKELDRQVKENDSTMGNFQRNVGNYPEVFDLSGTAIGKLQGILSGFGGTSKTVGGVVGSAFSGIKTQAIALGKAFLTPPIGLIVVILTAIMFAVQKVVQAFKKNDEASEGLKKAFSVLTPIAEGVSWIFDKLALVISKVAIGFSKALGAVLNLIPGYKKAAKAANDLVDAQDKLEEKERSYTVNSAKRNAEIAKLKKEAVNTQKYTTKQIEDMLVRADELEQQNMRENLANKAEALKNIKQLAKQEVDTSDETAKKIADARAAFFQAEESYYSGTMRIASKLNSAREKQASEEKERHEAAIERNKKLLENQKDASEKAIEISRNLEDAILAGKKDSTEKQIAQERLNTNRQIEEIENRLANEKNLTSQARSDLQALIIQLNNNLYIKIDEIEENAKKESIQKQADAEAEKLRLKLETAEKEKQLNKIVYDNKKQIIDNEFANMKLALDEQMATAVEYANVELAQAQQQSDDLINIDAAKKSALYESEAQYDAAVIDSKSKVIAATIAVQEAEKKQLELQTSAIISFGDTVSNVLSEIASDSKEAMIFMKFIALANAAIKLGEAIANASVPSAVAVAGGPLAVAADIAAKVGAVVVAFSQVTKSIKAANAPTPPKFAGGGIVPGTSYSGDTVSARLNSGEMVLNFEQQKRLFDMIAKSNNTTGSLIDYELLAKAISRQPAPKLIYKEFTDFQEKIVTFDEHIKI